MRPGLTAVPVGAAIKELESEPTLSRRSRGRARWAAALVLVVTIAALIALPTAPAAAQSVNTSPVAVKLASLPSPTAVAATSGELLSLSGASCSKVYSISANGSVTTFATLATSLSKCSESAIAISPGLGNFPAGEVFVLLAGHLFEIPANGSVGPVAAALTLTNLTSGSMGLTFDDSGSFGFGLLATGGSHGYAVEIDAANDVRSIGTFGATVEGPAVAPLSFGTVGGDLLAAVASKSTVVAMTPAGATLPFATWKSTAEAVSFVPTLGCSFSTTGDSYFVADMSLNSVLAVPASDFSGVIGSGLVLGESRGVGTGLLSSNGSTSKFLPIRGSLEGASYVSCPVGVAKSTDLSSRGLNGTDLNLIGYDPAAQDLVGVDPMNAPSQVFMLNGSTTDFVQNVSTGLDPAAVAYDPCADILFVANSGSDNVSLLNASSFQELGNFSTGANSTPIALAFDPFDQVLYVANAGNDTVVAYYIGNGWGFGPNAVAVAHSLWFIHFRVAQLTGTPDGMVVNPSDGNVYVVGNVAGAGTIWEIHYFWLVRTLSVGLDARSISLNNGTGALYVTLNGSNEIAFVTPGDNLSTTVSIPNPVGAAFDPANGLLFVVSEDGNLSVLQSSSILATYPFGGNPGPLIYDPAANLVFGAADVTVFGLDPRIIIGGSG